MFRNRRRGQRNRLSAGSVLFHVQDVRGRVPGQAKAARAATGGDLMTAQTLTQGQLFRMAVVRLVAAIPILALVLFLPAGTWNYWEAWAYLAILLIPMLLVLLYLLKYNPDLLERRMRMREKETQQKGLVLLSLVYFLLVYSLPGLDHRFGWSHVPVAVVLAAQVAVLLGYGIVFLVFRENRFAARVVEVEERQTVIGSGPYAVVRHPMYVGVTIMYIFSPLALGSYWAVLPALLIIPLLAARILNEESVLMRDLPGYTAYMQKVGRRLIPGVW
jgi:protein-S-isoprenylcysteine O-methyltransferase Ste14